MPSRLYGQMTAYDPFWPHLARSARPEGLIGVERGQPLPGVLDLDGEKRVRVAEQAQEFLIPFDDPHPNLDVRPEHAFSPKVVVVLRRPIEAQGVDVAGEIFPSGKPAISS